MAEIARATGRRVVPVRRPRRVMEDCDNLVDAADPEVRWRDVLVNNAGMSPAYDDLASGNEDLDDRCRTSTRKKLPFRRARPSQSCC